MLMNFAVTQVYEYILGLGMLQLFVILFGVAASFTYFIIFFMVVKSSTVNKTVKKKGQKHGQNISDGPKELDIFLEAPHLEAMDELPEKDIPDQSAIREVTSAETSEDTSVSHYRPITDDGTAKLDLLDQKIEMAGYAYDAEQDIFYSVMNPWQKKFGYCRLYDEAAAPMSMIIDCEPIYFDYNGKSWMIEFWKGQYGMTTGCELGIYTKNKPDLDIPGIFQGPFFEAVQDNDQLDMSYILRKNGKTLFTRKDRHWWLTGFRLGEFSEPSELVMYLYMNMKDETMCRAFINGLREVGYTEDEYRVMNNLVAVKFDKPHSQQPLTRTKHTDWLIQRKNKLLCDKYQEITKDYKSTPDKLSAIKDMAPDLHKLVAHIGKNQQVFSDYDKIKKYME